MSSPSNFNEFYQSYLSHRNKKLAAPNSSRSPKSRGASRDGSRVKVLRSSNPNVSSSYVGYERMDYKDLFDVVLQSSTSNQVKQHNVTRGALEKLWDEFCRYIKLSLERDLSVIIPSFGTFTTARDIHDSSSSTPVVNKVPILVLSDEYSAKYGVKHPKYANHSGKGIAPTFKSSIYNSTTSQEIISDIFKYLGLCSQGLAGRKNYAQLKLNNMGVMKVNNGKLTIDWYPDFFKELESVGAFQAPGQMKAAQHNKKLLSNVRKMHEAEDGPTTPKARPPTSPKSDDTHSSKSKAKHETHLNKTLPCLSPVDGSPTHGDLVPVCPKELKESWSRQIRDNRTNESREKEEGKRERELQDLALKMELKRERERKFDERNMIRNEMLATSPLIESRRNTRDVIAAKYRQRYAGSNSLPLHAGLIELEEQHKRLNQRMYKEQLDKQIESRLAKSLEVPKTPAGEKRWIYDPDADRIKERQERLAKQREFVNALNKQMEEKKSFEFKNKKMESQLTERLFIEGRDVEQMKKSKELATSISKQNYDAMVQKSSEAKSRKQEEMTHSFTDMMNYMGKREELLRNEIRDRREFAKKYTNVLKEQQQELLEHKVL